MEKYEVQCVCGAKNLIPRDDSVIANWLCGNCKKPLAGNGGPVPKHNECFMCEEIDCHDNILVNGVHYHSYCFEDLKDKIENLHNEISQSQLTEHVLKEKIDKSKTFWGSLRRAFTGEAIDIEEMHKAINLQQKQIDELKRKLKYAEAKQEYVYDYWPKYPPDWDERVEKVRERDNECVECGSSRRLHVHHIIRIGNGGNHTILNLELLCSDCHSSKHKGKNFSRNFKNDEKPSFFSKRLDLIEKAIAYDSKIHFKYTKYDGEKTTRTIEPEEILKVGQSLCVRGWCHLRDDQRTFAIKRMRKVRILE